MWSGEVLTKLSVYTQVDRARLCEDARNRLSEMNEATHDCVQKIHVQLSADTSTLEADVTNGLKSCAEIIERINARDNQQEQEDALEVKDAVAVQVTTTSEHIGRVTAIVKQNSNT